MRLRWRPAKMSLATKSRVLFGISAVVIIGAALFVPFQRMEQLTAELNSSAGRALATIEVARHVAEMEARVAPSQRTRRPPAAAPSTTRPTSLPAQLAFGELEFAAPRLIAAAELQAMPANSFERQAFERFSRRSDRNEQLQQMVDPHGQIYFKYARSLRLEPSCITCHASGETAAIRPLPASRPTTQSASTPFGIITLEIPNQVRPEQVIINRVFLVMAGLFSGLLAIVILSFVISRLILRPVRILQETAEKVSDGDLNIRATINSGDEFQRLGETFNTMLINLKRGADQLQAANRTLDMKLVQLAETNSGLNEANRLKNEFLANVSHELRTPLNSILGFAELIRSSQVAAADPKVARFVSNITHSGENLLDLINDLLDIAKIEAGRIEIRPSDLSVSDLLESLVSLLKPVSEKKRLNVLTRTAADVPIIRTDPTRLQQVLYNLLSNAIKFSPDGETIDVLATRPDDEHIMISVIDRGPGIDPKQQQLIFEKFRQLDASATRTHGGTGLGLSISRELMRLLQGTLGVNSTPGQGATFYLVLPIRIEADSAGRASVVT